MVEHSRKYGNQNHVLSYWMTIERGGYNKKKQQFLTETYFLHCDNQTIGVAEVSREFCTEYVFKCAISIVLIM